MWRFSAIIMLFIAMMVAYYSIPHYVTGTSAFELILTNFGTYMITFIIISVAIVILMRD
jgi:hypothetical protein